MKNHETDINKVILYQIDKTSRVAKQYSQKILDHLGLGITIEQWVLLKIIEENTPLTQKELATKSLRDPASITRTLDILGKKNLVNRETVEGNRRQYNIVLTATGQEFVQNNMNTISDLRDLSVKGFTPEEVRLLLSLLLKIQSNMS